MFSYPADDSTIGAVCDGARTWSSNFPRRSYTQYDPATGAPLAVMSAGV